MMHDYHEGLPGFDAEQLLHDGCGECERRAEREDHGLDNLDLGNFRRAWERAAQWELHGCQNISKAEAPLLAMLWRIQVQLERQGIPYGTIPVVTA